MSEDKLSIFIENAEDSDDETPDVDTRFVNKEDGQWIFIHGPESEEEFIGVGPDSYIQLEEAI